MEDVLAPEEEIDEHRTLVSRLDKNATEWKRNETSNVGAEGEIEDRRKGEIWTQRCAEAIAAGHDQREDGVLDSPPMAQQRDSGAAGDSDPAISRTLDWKAMRSEGPAAGYSDPKVATSLMNGELDIHDDWPMFEDEHVDDILSLLERENDAEETLEDMDLLKALNQRASSRGVGNENLEEYFKSLAQPHPEQEPFNRTIHILGLGLAGNYIAHSLASLPFAPPITLLMHRPLMMQHWHDEGAAIHVIEGGKIKTQTNFHIESSADFVRQHSEQQFPGFGPNLEHTSEPPSYPIDALIVTTEANKAVAAISPIKHRLGRSSTIFLLHRGLGLVERINEILFPDPYNRPTYVLGAMSHALEPTERRFTLIERVPGRLECSKFPQVSTTRRKKSSPKLTRKDFSWTVHASHLVGTLARTPEFGTVTLGHKSFCMSRLQHLASGAVIGPLSVSFDCTNDLILYNYNASRTMRLLLHEISQVIRALPELQSLPGLDETFSVKKLEAITVSRIAKTGKNFSEMLLSVRAGKRTNIDYYNGYIERRARELRISTPMNQMMVLLVKGKTAAKSRELNDYIPYEVGYKG